MRLARATAFDVSAKHSAVFSEDAFRDDVASVNILGREKACVENVQHE